MEIDKTDKDKFFTHWDEKRKIFTMQVFFKVREDKDLPELQSKATAFMPITGRG